MYSYIVTKKKTIKKVTSRLTLLKRAFMWAFGQRVIAMNMGNCRK